MAAKAKYELSQLDGRGRDGERDVGEDLAASSVADQWKGTD